MVAHTYNPSTQEPEAGGPGVQGQKSSSLVFIKVVSFKKWCPNG
jgi:hypothetical protein